MTSTSFVIVTAQGHVALLKGKHKTKHTATSDLGGSWFLKRPVRTTKRSPNRVFVLQMTWPPRRTANLRRQQHHCSAPAEIDCSSTLAANFNSLDEVIAPSHIIHKEEGKLVLNSFPNSSSITLNDLLFRNRKNCHKIEEDGERLTDNLFMLTIGKPRYHSESVADWNVLQLFGLAPTDTKYRKSSLTEKLTVLFADLVCDFLVLDTLWRANSVLDILSFVFGGFLAYLTADLISGLFVWASKNYFSNPQPCNSFFASRKTSSFAQEDIDDEELDDFFSNVFSYCLLTIPFLVALIYFRGVLSTFMDSFLIFFFSLIAIWPEANKWCHMSDPKNPPPPIVRLLQSLGFLIPIHEHVWHHYSHLFYRHYEEGATPLEETEHVQPAAYCSLSGHWNRVLDATGFFRKLEWVIYYLLRIEPKLWNSYPNLKNMFKEREM